MIIGKSLAQLYYEMSLPYWAPHFTSGFHSVPVITFYAPYKNGWRAASMKHVNELGLPNVGGGGG